MRPGIGLWLIGLLLCVGCSGDSVRVAEGVEVPRGFEATIYADGFDRPTQMFFTANGDLIIAELNGAENDATGRILRVSADDPDNRAVLQTGLDKPTGIALVGDRLWIMERRRLSVTTMEPEAPREIVADEMPYNGRSQGSLTVLSDGRLLYDTSGSKQGANRVAGSGTIFAIEDPTTGLGNPTVVATGFKHAYTQLLDDDGQLWSVEMTDGNFDGERAPDELVAIRPGDDGGWPQCVGNNRPVSEYGGSPELCSSSPSSHALLGFGAAPTSLLVAPWDANTFILALWLPGQVVTVPRRAPAGEPHEPTVFATGISSPQHLLATGDAVLVSDHETGQIIAITPVD